MDVRYVFTRKSYMDLRHRSANFIQEVLMRASILTSVETIDGLPHSESSDEKCFGLDQCSGRNNVPSPQLTRLA